MVSKTFELTTTENASSMTAQSKFYGEGRDVFWAEIPPSEHILQIYESDGVFFDTLEGFVVGGLHKGESAIVIATPAHLRSLDARLQSAGLAVSELRARDQYGPLDAEKTLEMFMVNGWPDEARFVRLIKGLVACARRDARKVRAFGEMVAILWARGEHEATMRLDAARESLAPALCG
jgi:hypothetical protein